MATYKGTIKKWLTSGSLWDILYPQTTIDQVIDLSTALANMQGDVDAKQDALGFTPYNATNPSGFITVSPLDSKIYLKSNTDNRAAATIPNDYNSKFEIKGLKQNTTIGITSGGTYSAVLGIRGWADSSGGEAHELAFDQLGRINHRYGTTTVWNAWKTLIESDDYRLSNSRVASDVYAWAKASDKPSYNASEIGTLDATHRWLTDTYISTWNAKQNALTNPVTGTGAANNIAYWNASNTISYLDTASYPGLTEISYIKGLTSAIQTQLNAKSASNHNHSGVYQPVPDVGDMYIKFTGTPVNSTLAYFSGTTGLVASLPLASYPSLSELAFVKGVTSGIQAQLNGKVTANTAITGATNTKITYDSKGLVTGGTTLSVSDIPALAYVETAKLLTTSNAGAIAIDNVTVNTIGYTNALSILGQTDGAIYAGAYSSSWVHEIYGDFRTGQIALRGKNNGVWQAWRTVRDTGNFVSDVDFAPAHAHPYLPSAGGTMAGNTIVSNHGIGNVGLYASDKYQAVFSMGAAYAPAADGSSLANSYGLVWTHSNVGGQSKNLGHQLLITEAGVTQTALGNGIWTRANIEALGTIQGTQLKSTIATGTAPLTVVSATVVANLNADLLDGYHAASTATAATIVLRDASGYIYGTYFNSNRGDETTAAASYIYDTGDGWMRKKTLANAKTELHIAPTKAEVEAVLTGAITSHTHPYATASTIGGIRASVSGTTLTINLTA